MATYYNGLPSLPERVRASSLIAIATIEAVELPRRERIGEFEEQQAVARVVLDEVLKGPSDRMTALVRFVVPGLDSRGKTPHPMREGQRVVLMLVPAVGREAGLNTFVPYFHGHFALAGRDAFRIPAKSGRRVAATVTLKKLRSLIEGAAAAVEGERRLWSRYEPQLLAEGRPPPITEIPFLQDAGTMRNVAPLPDRRRPRVKRKR